MTPNEAHQKAINLLATKKVYVRYEDGRPVAIAAAGFDIVHLENSDRTAACVEALVNKTNEH